MTLADVLNDALERRRAWLAEAAARGTDCVRLLSGAVEGAPGITIDRYGSILLIQTGREPLPDEGAPYALAQLASRALGVDLEPVWNHRPAYRREGFDRFFRAPEALRSAIAPVAPLRDGIPTPAEDGVGSSSSRCRANVTPLRSAIGLEEGMRFLVDPRRGGLDPLLFLDLRAGRRRVRALARDRSALNLFAYTCGLGVAAALGGAREVVNVDFARSALDVGAENARLNALEGPAFSLVHEDVLPVVRQLGGLPIKGRGARRPFLRLAPRRFGLVMLDPPRWAKSPFGAVDVVRDYPSLLKPALLALEPGGILFATNHVPSVPRDTFVAMASRTAEKIGRSLEDIEVIAPDPDFPSPDAQPPLKMLLARVE